MQVRFGLSFVNQNRHAELPAGWVVRSSTLEYQAGEAERKEAMAHSWKHRLRSKHARRRCLSQGQ